MKTQYIEIKENGDKYYYKDKKMAILHREDGPAIEETGGHKEWLIDGKYHREDGPAIEYSNGGKEWWIDDRLHREDGPAIHRSDGEKFWFINDEEVTEEQHKAHFKSTKKKRYTYTFDLSASIDSDHSEFEKITLEELKDAVMKRLENITNEEGVEPFGFVDAQDNNDDYND